MSVNNDCLIEDIDQYDRSDPIYLAEHVNDIYFYLREKEQANMLELNPDYLADFHPNLNSGMRSVLIDWLIDVGAKFKLLNDAVHLTLVLIDRFLNKFENLHRSKLQLVGMTCMLIACKFEEIFAPEIADFVYICDRAYTVEDIYEMELKILQTLEYEIAQPTSIHFLRRFSKAADNDTISHVLGKYFIELAAVHYESLKVPPSLIAASAVFLSRLVHLPPDREQDRIREGVKSHLSWDATMQHYTRYSLDDISPVVRKLVEWARELQPENRPKLTAVYRKYSRFNFKVATFTLPSDAEIESHFSTNYVS